MTPAALLRSASLAEASTLAALVLVAVPAKHFAGASGLVHFMGPLHGVAFLFYIWALIQAATAGGWRIGELIRMIVVACIPLAGFANQAWLARKLGAVER